MTVQLDVLVVAPDRRPAKHDGSCECGIVRFGRDQAVGFGLGLLGRELKREASHTGPIEARNQPLYQFNVMADTMVLAQKHDLVRRELADHVVLG